MVYIQTHEECTLPVLLASSRHWQTAKQDHSLQAQKKVSDDKSAVPARTMPLNSKVKARIAEISNAPRLFRILRHNETIEDHFTFGEEIYDGGSRDKVLNAKKKKVEKGESPECVVKIQRKTERKLEKMEETRWREVMKKLFTLKACPNVLNIQAIFEDDKSFYVVMEKCSGGELFNFLLNETEVKMTECKRIIREILVALNDLHSKGLFHGDVKPENIMFSDATTRTLKLIDFDTCQLWDPNAPKAHRFAGSPGYIAPETLCGKASPQSDLWAVGVILFTLMTGYMPFDQEVEDTRVDGLSAKGAYHDLKQQHIDWEEGSWVDFPVAADLCRQLLAFDPVDRLQSATDALRHPWLQQRQRK